MDSNGESGSITNQIELLTKYAESNGITPIQDDGWSGTSWSRPGWTELMGYVERGEVATILVKTLDRVGRDHLRVGLLLEQFQEQGIRLIAIGDGIDTAQGVDDFIPPRHKPQNQGNQQRQNPRRQARHGRDTLRLFA
jgi:DNA invertase Pin-like site-specific DNA recombinase